MSKTIPCPNPICTHAFSLADLQAASQLLCPKCGFRMAGKGAASTKPAATPRPKADATLPPTRIAPKPPAAPVTPPAASPVPAQAPSKLVMATPVPAPTAAQPILATAVTAAPPAPPTAATVRGEESISEGSFFNPGFDAPSGPLLRSSQRKKKGGGGKKLFVAVLAIGIAVSAVVIGVGFLVFFVLGGGDTGIRTAAAPEGTVYNGNLRNAKGELEKAYKLVLNKNDWAPDNEISASCKAHAAWKNKEQEFWFAILIKDYGMFKPRDADMLRFGIDKLKGHFGDTLELAAKGEPPKIGELPAQKLKFTGQVKAAKWIGDCIMFFKDGIAYWLFMCSPDPGVVDQFAAELPEKNFFVVTERRGWREQPVPMETWTSINGKLAVTTPKEMWDKHNAKNEDEKGELLLFGRYQKEKEKDNTKNAQVLIFALDPQKDLQEAMKAARDYLEKKQLSGENNGYKIVSADAQGDGGIVDNVGNRRGRLIDLKLQFNDEPKRYYLLAVLNEPDSAYGILCECTWESRQIWRQEFLELLRTLNVKKGE